MGTMLLVVDPQIDFIIGSLAVPNAVHAMDKLSAYLVTNDNYDVKIVTTDFHPYNHCSFKNQGGPWPRHCVRHTPGAAIWPPLLKNLYVNSDDVMVMQKGCEPDIEEYSIFKNHANSQRFLDIVAERQIERIDICGIAGDICVLNTLKDGIALIGPAKFRILREFSPSLDGGKALDQYCGSHPL